MAHNKAALDKVVEDKRLGILGAIKAFDLPPLEEGSDAYTALEASLVQHSCFSNVVMHGDEVISGRACKAICDKHRIKYEIIKVDDWDQADLVSITNDLNFCGRHIDSATKKAYAKHLLLATKGKLSNRAIGSMACLDSKTVQVVRESLEASAEIPHTATRYSRDGRSQDVSDKEDRKGKPTGKDAPEDQQEGDEQVPEEDEEDEGEEEVISLSLVEADTFDLPETCPDYVYEVNKDRASIVRRKVNRQRGDKYYLSNGESLSKRYSHPTWLGAHDSLVLALQTEKDEIEEEMEELTEQKKKLVLQLKNIEAQMLEATKEKEKLGQRIEKVEKLVPPKGAAAETEEEAA